MKNILKIIGVVILLLLASVGWIVLLVQNPVILAKARFRYQQGIWGKMEIDKHIVEMSSKGEVINVK